MSFFEELDPKQQGDILVSDWCTRGYISVVTYLAFYNKQVTFKELGEEARRRRDIQIAIHRKEPYIRITHE